LQRLPHDETDRDQLLFDLDEIARQGARQMLAQALEAEVRDYLDAARGECEERGHALVVRNGHANEREVILGAGSITLKAPWVNDKRVDEDGKRRRFKSVILQPYTRKSPKVTEVLPLLYLHGLSSGDFTRALGSSSARGRALVRRAWR
jgi:putative transposase